MADTKYTSVTECRWKSYGHYKLILLAWMLNEVSMVSTPAKLSHNALYMLSILQVISAIFIGIPLVYSEICLAQYTNSELISTWNFFPILRPVGYATIYLVFLKTLYITVLTSWYLQYSFYSVLDPPPWFSCDDFDINECMVKRINVSVFQRCLEAQLLFDDDCGMKTASAHFFEREVGGKNSVTSLYCVLSWKSITASVIINTALYVLSLKKVKFIQVTVKLLVVYVSIVMLVLLSVALSTSGAWYAITIAIDWQKYDFDYCFLAITRGFLSFGTGFGIIGFLTRDISFRSPATMTSISISVLSMFVSGTYTLIVFSGIKTMSYYHGEELYVIELGGSYFSEFASISEILSYFDQTSLWEFLWFSSIFLCLLVNLWILHLFLKDLIFKNLKLANRHTNLCNMIVTMIICLFSWPLFCVDIANAVSEAIQLIQILNNFIFSISLYWIYGFKNHNVDITFMIGIKASYFWKITWIINPILILIMFYVKCITLTTQDVESTMFLEQYNTYLDMFIVYVLCSIYGFIIFVGILIQLVYLYRFGMLKFSYILQPVDDWGPKDNILFKSRKMFVPEIMTREFLYRQVRIHGYTKRSKMFVNKQKVAHRDSGDLSSPEDRVSTLN